MSVENIKKFFLLVEKEPEFRIRFKAAFNELIQGDFNEKAVEKVFVEEILPFAKEKDLVVSVSDLYPFRDKVLFGKDIETTLLTTDKNDYLLTYVDNKCSEWKSENRWKWWIGKYYCGSCEHWFAPTDVIWGFTSWGGVPGLCTKHKVKSET